jgi:hypothetical protein
MRVMKWYDKWLNVEERKKGKIRMFVAPPTQFLQIPIVTPKFLKLLIHVKQVFSTLKNKSVWCHYWGSHVMLWLYAWVEEVLKVKLVLLLWFFINTPLRFKL